MSSLTTARDRDFEDGQYPVVERSHAQDVRRVAVGSKE